MQYLQQYYYGSFADAGCQNPPSDGSHFANILFNTKIDLVEWSMILIFGENAIFIPKLGSLSIWSLYFWYLVNLVLSGNSLTEIDCELTTSLK